MPAEPAVADAPTLTEPNPQDAPVAEPIAVPAAEAVNPRLLAALGIPDDMAKQVFGPIPEPKAEEPKAEALPPPEEKEPEPEKVEEPPTAEKAEEPEPELDASTPDWAKQRIGKLTGQREEARRERAALNEQFLAAQERIAQLEAQPSVTVQPSANDPLADVTDLATLKTKVDAARHTKRWCRQNPEGVTVNEGVEGKERFIAPEAIRDMLGNAEDVIDEYAPRKAYEIQLREENNEVARKVNPDLFKRGTEAYQVAQTAMQEIPGLANHPAAHLFIAYYYAGVQADIADSQAKAAKNGNGHGPKPVLDPRLTAEALSKIPPLAPVTASPPNALGKVGGAQARVEEAKTNMVTESGSRESLVAAVRAMREAGENGTNPRSAAPI